MKDHEVWVVAQGVFTEERAKEFERFGEKYRLGFTEGVNALRYATERRLQDEGERQ